VREATDTLVAQHLERAGERADAEDLQGALAELGQAERLVRQAASAGVRLPDLAGREAALRQRAAVPSLRRAEVALTDGRWRDAVSAFGAALALLDAADRPPVEAQLTDALRSASTEARGRDRAELLETLAARTGAGADRSAAASAWRALAGAEEDRGDVRAAVEALSRAVVHDPSLAEELGRVEALAWTDVVLRVSGPDRQVVAAMREGLEAALRSRGSRFLRVVSRGGQPRRIPGEEGPLEVEPAQLVVRLGTPSVTQGEPSTRRVTRPEGAITKVVEEGSLVVQVALDAQVVLQVAERSERTRRTEEAAETARWDGKVRAVRTPMGSQRLKGSKRSGERAPAVEAARDHATAAVVTRLASELAAEVLRQVDRSDPRRPPVPAQEAPQRP
jgi:tetratricopeptide (TPR) repeat protein